MPLKAIFGYLLQIKELVTYSPAFADTDCFPAINNKWRRNQRIACTSGIKRLESADK